MGIFDLFSSDNEYDAFQAQKQGYQQGQRGAEKFIGQGIDQLKQLYGQAGQHYAGLPGQYRPDNQYIGQLAQRGGGYLDAYEGALGLNGKAAAQKSFNQYQSLPGFQFQLDQATQAVDRGAASRGLLGSGNTQLAVSETARKMAEADYGSYLDRLGSLGSMGYGGIGTAAGLTNSNEQFGANYGLNLAGAKAGLQTGLGGQIMGGYNTLAGNAYGAGVGIGQAQGNYLTSLDQTGANILGTGLGIAGAVAGMPPVGMGGAPKTLGGQGFSYLFN